MYPLLDTEGEMTLVDARVLKVRRVRRNEVIKLHNPMPSPQLKYRSICKRVLAVEGDMVRPHGSFEWLEIPKGYIWIEGDNPYNSTDSRVYGPVPEALALGLCRSRIFPPHRVRVGEREVGFGCWGTAMRWCVQCADCGDRRHPTAAVAASVGCRRHRR